MSKFTTYTISKFILSRFHALTVFSFCSQVSTSSSPSLPVFEKKVGGMTRKKNLGTNSDFSSSRRHRRVLLALVSSSTTWLCFLSLPDKVIWGEKSHPKNNNRKCWTFPCTLSPPFLCVCVCLGVRVCFDWKDFLVILFSVPSAFFPLPSLLPNTQCEMCTGTSAEIALFYCIFLSTTLLLKSCKICPVFFLKKKQKTPTFFSLFPLRRKSSGAFYFFLSLSLFLSGKQHDDKKIREEGGRRGREMEKGGRRRDDESATTFPFLCEQISFFWRWVGGEGKEEEGYFYLFSI